MVSNLTDLFTPINGEKTAGRGGSGTTLPKPVTPAPPETLVAPGTRTPQATPVLHQSTPREPRRQPQAAPASRSTDHRRDGANEARLIRNEGPPPGSVARKPREGTESTGAPPATPAPPEAPAPGTGKPPEGEPVRQPTPVTPSTTAPVAEVPGDTGTSPTDTPVTETPAPVTETPAPVTETPADGTGYDQGMADLNKPKPTPADGMPDTDPAEAGLGINPETGNPLQPISFETVNLMISGGEDVNWDLIADSQMSPEEVASLDAQYTNAMSGSEPLDEASLKRVMINRLARSSLGTGVSPKEKLAEYLRSDGVITMDELEEIAAGDDSNLAAFKAYQARVAGGAPGTDAEGETDPNSLSSWWGSLESDQRMAMMIGIPLALIGVIGSMTEGGVGNMMTAILGIGAMAYGGIPGVRTGMQGMLGEGGMLGGIGKMLGFGGSSGGYDAGYTDDGSGNTETTAPVTETPAPGDPTLAQQIDKLPGMGVEPGASSPGPGTTPGVVMGPDGKTPMYDQGDDTYGPDNPVDPFAPVQPGDTAAPVTPPVESPFGAQSAQYDLDGSGTMDEAELVALKANPVLLQRALEDAPSARAMLMSALRPDNQGPEASELRKKFTFMRGMFVRGGVPIAQTVDGKPNPEYASVLSAIRIGGKLGFEGSEEDQNNSIHKLALIVNGLPPELFN